MSGKIDTPFADPEPHPGARSRTKAEAAHPIWLSEPIDLRLAIERLETEPAANASSALVEQQPEEIARRLRERKSAC